MAPGERDRRGAPKRASGAAKRGGPAKAGGAAKRGAPGKRGLPVKGGPPPRRTTGAPPKRATGGAKKRGGPAKPARRKVDPAILERIERRDATDARSSRAGWGGVARRGAHQVGREEEPGGRPGAPARKRPAGPGAAGRPSASSAWRKAVAEARGDEPAATDGGTEEWIDHGEVRSEASSAVARGERRPRREPARRPTKRAAPAAGDRPARADRPLTVDAPASTAVVLEARLRDATRAYERERYQDAKRLLGPLAQRVPGAASVRELYGLTLYRMGRWKEAVKELEAFRSLTGSSEQNPVLADSYRALGRYAEVDALWRELREHSPSAELVAEGRIVAAGALADQDRVEDAVRLLEQGVKRGGKAPRHARPHHLRLWYALADLYERTGDVPQARDLFRRIEAAAPDFADVTRRVRALR